MDLHLYQALGTSAILGAAAPARPDFARAKRLFGRRRFGIEQSVEGRRLGKHTLVS